MLLAILIMLMVLAPRLYNLATTGVFGGQALSFTTIDQGTGLRAGFQLQTPALYVIANDQDVDTLAQTVLPIDPQFYDKQRQIVDQLRQVDYNHSSAVLVLHGQRGSTRYGVTVQQLTRDDHRVRIGARFTEPGFMQGAGAAFTDPYHIVAVAKEGMWGRPIDFELYCWWASRRSNFTFYSVSCKQDGVGCHPAIIRSKSDPTVAG
jgi:hypothetical protein